MRTLSLEEFFDIQQAFFNYADFDSLIAAILDFLPRLGADFGSVLLRLPDETLYFRSSLPSQDELTGPAGRRFAQKLLNRGLEGHILRVNKPAIVPDTTRDPRWYRASYLMDVCRSAVILPITLPKLPATGTLLLGSVHRSVFSAEDIPQQQRIVQQLAYAIESALIHKNQIERTTYLNLINEVSQAATSILNQNLMLTTISQAIHRIFKLHSVGVYHYHAKRKELFQGAFIAADSRSLPEQTVSFSQVPFVSWAIQHQKPLVINDAKADSRFIPSAEQADVRSIVALPIKLGAKVLGALSLESVRLDAFSPSLVTALETLTDQLAVAIENARLYDELNNTVSELVALNKISLSISASLDFQYTLTLITDLVTVMLNVAATSVALRNDDTGEVWFVAASGMGAERVLDKRLPLGRGIIGWVAQKGDVLIVDDVTQDARFYEEFDKESGFTTHSILCVPLRTKGRLIGAIEAINKKTGHFSQDDVDRLQSLTAPAATAIENAQLYQELAQRIQQVETLRAFNQNIIENMTSGLIGIDQWRAITVFNKAAADMLALSPDAAIGQPIDEVLHRYPQLPPLLSKPFSQSNPVSREEAVIETPQGNYAILSVTITPLFAPDHTLTGVVALIEDITEQKAVEAQRRRMDRLIALGEMSAVVAHEMRNPLAGIAAGVSYLSKKIPPESRDYQAGQMILQEVDRMQRIIEDILSIAHTPTLSTADHRLPDIVAAIEQRFAAPLEKKHLIFLTHLDPNLPVLHIDRDKIEQVLNNLMENAIHATPAGGQIRLMADYLPEQAEVEILFTDTGSGISEEAVSKIFDPFITTKSRGTGLGLPLSRQIIEAHRGQLDLAHTGENGTTFLIRLPV